MKVRMLQGAVGQNFSYMPRQVFECPEPVGLRLISERIAVKAKADAEVDGEWPVRTDEEAAEAHAEARAKYKRMGLDPDKVFAKRRGVPERAVSRKAETPEGASSDEPGKCTGATGQGNPCGRTALPGTDRCAKHPKD